MPKTTVRSLARTVARGAGPGTPASALARALIIGIGAVLGLGEHAGAIGVILLVGFIVSSYWFVQKKRTRGWFEIQARSDSIEGQGA